MPKATRNKTTFPGVRYRTHETRKHGIQKDKYFTIRYQLNGKSVEEGIGWASEGHTPSSVYELLAELKRNHTTGTGPLTMAEKRKLAEQAREAERLAELEAARQTELDSVKNMTVGALFKNYLENGMSSKSPNSVRTEKISYRLHIAPVIGNRILLELVPLDLERLKSAMLKKGKSPRTVEYTLAIVRQAINFGKRNNLYSGENPAAHVKAPRFDNRRLRFLTREEAELLLVELKKMSLDVHDQVLLSLHTGMRAGEILNLTWQDVDLERGGCTLRDTKNAKTRRVYLTERTRAMLAGRRWPKTQGAEHVFQGRNGKASSISRTFDRAVERLGLNDGITDRRYRVCFHSMRHSFASWLVENGINLYSLKELLGHGDFKMTSRYAHLAPETLQAAVATLDTPDTSQTPDNVIQMPRQAGA